MGVLTPEELAAIRRQAEAEYPRECCGVVLVRPGSPGARRLMPCRNVQDELHARDPARHPREARHAYSIAPEQLLEIGRAEDEGYAVHVIYHSHVDVGAYFSETDRRNALLDGRPLYPDTVYVVVGVRAARADEVCAVRWNPGAGDFTAVPLDPA